MKANPTAARGRRRRRQAGLRGLAFAAAALAASAGLRPGVATAHGEPPQAAGPAAKVQKPWGIAADAKAVVRTVEFTMGDDMRFRPDRLEVREGETLRLRIRNTGAVMHEFVLGTRAELEAHAAMMLRFPDMQHDEPDMAHVPPGGSSEIIWHFNRAGEFDFACLIAGHYQAGMTGRVSVRPRR